MGSKQTKSESFYHPWVIISKTGDYKGAGTDANIYVYFYDKEGNRSPQIHLDLPLHNDNERGSEDRFPVSDLGKVTEPTTLELWRDKSGFGDDWYCELIKLEGSTSTYTFPVLRWIEPKRHYKIPLNDTSLPQNDPFPEERKQELRVRRTKYEFKQLSIPNLPIVLKSLPIEEQFSDDYLRGLLDTRKQTYSAFLLGLLDPRKWIKYDHLSRCYSHSKAYPEPRAYKLWRSDEWFGAQRLSGVNPQSLELCTKIPDNFLVSDELLSSLLEGLSIQEALDTKRLFIINLHFMDGIQCQKGFTTCAPIGLFFLNEAKKLMPVAIQLYQGKYNPIFTPSIDEHKWLLAKIWFSLMDANYHQPVIHLGLTHLVMESISVAMHRCLAPNHPIFRLISPHLIYLMAINRRALDKLVNMDDGGLLDMLMSLGTRGGLTVLSRLWPDYRLDVDATLPENLKARGVDDPSVLPEFPYRDDGMLVYNAIQSYVTDIVNAYYESDADIESDEEVISWVLTLAKSFEAGGAGFKGLPNDGQLRTKAELSQLCTTIIFTGSAQHAAVNFGQYDNYGVQFNYPGKLAGIPPSNTDPITEEEVMRHLPTRKEIFQSMTTSKVLSQLGTKRLGDWDICFQFDPPALEAEKRFREELDKASVVIKDRNSKRSEAMKYPYLDPENIPNAISI